MSTLSKYANLLVNYCLDLKSGQKLYITSTFLAEPLIKEVYREALKVGAFVDINLGFSGQTKIFFEEASDHQLNFISPLSKIVMEQYDAYLVIRAPFDLREDVNNNKEKTQKRALATTDLNKVYFKRIAEGSMVRCLCQYPTETAAKEAGMTLDEYTHFIYSACKLYDDDPKTSWLQVRKSQQRIVDYLNKAKIIRYTNPNMDVTFKVEGRTWINSDGRSNMPSGEVFTGPIEDSINGTVFFDYPCIFNGHEVKDIRLEVVNGEVVEWSAVKGQDLLDQIFEIPGAKFSGEVAIGTNYSIDKITKNILFDEKIGGSIHMAIGQSYIQTGGKNESPIHWDMIADMRNGGKIYADGELIYENGKFLI